MNNGSRARRFSRRGGLGAASLILFVLVTLLPAIASAQLTEEEKKYLEEKKEGPSTVYVIAPRFRAITIPNFIFDAFFGRHAETWAAIDEPNLAYGLEFILRDPKSNEFVFSIDYSDLSMRDEWWVESGKAARQADWTEFDLGLITLDASYNKWWPVSDVFAFYAGAGLGLGVVLGEVKKTDPTTQCIVALGASKDYNRLEDAPCEIEGQPQLDIANREEEDDIPPVIPVLALNAGAQVTIKEHLALRFDFGFKYYLYAGLSIGYQWW